MNISEERFRHLLENFLNGTATREERELLDRFFESYQDTNDGHVFIPGESKLSDEMLRQIYARAGVTDKKKNSRVWLAIAAAISLFVVAWFAIDREVFFPSASNAPQPLVQEKTARGEKSIIHLSDGTTVHLNSKSSISYPREFSGDSREVSISGEAYFDVVATGKPFIVHAGQLRAEVLGTSFNVKNKDTSNIAVTLVEGKVNIITPSGKSHIVKPNEQVVVDMETDTIQAAYVKVQQFTSWKDNVLFFEQVTLQEAVTQLEEWYDVKIDIRTPAVMKCLITAKYQDEPLGNVLNSLQFLLDLDVKRVKNAHYSINGKGCK